MNVSTINAAIEESMLSDRANRQEILVSGGTRTTVQEQVDFPATRDVNGAVMTSRDIGFISWTGGDTWIPVDEATDADFHKANRVQMSGLLTQDQFVKDNVEDGDFIVCSIGGNDIALSPTGSTVGAMTSVLTNPFAWPFIKNGWGVEENKRKRWKLSRFVRQNLENAATGGVSGAMSTLVKLFRDDIQNYLIKIIGTRKVSKVFVEEKLAKYFGYLARCDRNFGTTTLKILNFKFLNLNFWIKIKSKCRNRLCQNLKFRILRNFLILIPEKHEIGTSKL